MLPYTVYIQPPEAVLRLLILVAVVLAVPFASAQTAADIWPLVPGNSWSFVLESGVSAGSGGTYSNIEGGSRWTVTDSVDTVSGRLPGLSVDGTDCVVRISTPGGGLFELLDRTAQLPCAVSSFVRRIDRSPSFYVSSPDTTPRNIRIGGEILSDRLLRYGFEEGGSMSVPTTVNWYTTDGIGVLSYGSYSGRPSLAFTTGAFLRQATVRGMTIGQPIGTRTDFWPLAVGNRWEFLVADGPGASVGEVAWTVESSGTGLALRIVHTRDNTNVSTATCPISLVEASSATAWRTYFSLGDCVLPEPFVAPNIGGTAQPLRIDLFAVGDTVTIGPDTLTADVARGSSDNASQFADGPTSYSLARGIGPVRYDLYSRGSGQPAGYWRATLAFARIGDQTYGTRVVAGEDEPATTEALALSVGPNPVRASAQVAISLPAAAEARIEIVDALGRTVQRLDLGTRSAGAQSVRLDVSGLAAGVYSVRLVAGEAQTAARISVVR